MLKWLKKKVYSSLSEVLAAVYKELDSLQPVDTDTVKWTKGLTGMKAHAVVQNSPVAMNQVQDDSGPGPIYARVKLLNYPRTMQKYKSVVITGYDDTETSIETGIASSNPPELPTLVSDYNEISTGTLPNTLPFGVLQQEFSLSNPTSNICTVILSGLTLAWVNLDFIRDDRIYCTLPTSYGYLHVANQGLAKIIWRPAVSSGTKLCIVNMGSGCDSRYFGTFKVGRIDGVMYLYDGSNPDSDVAGVIKAGTTSISVPKTEITIESGYVYVYLTYDTETSSYSVTVTTTYTTPGDRTECYTIARIYQSAVVTQMHITGDITVVGRWV